MFSKNQVKESVIWQLCNLGHTSKTSQSVIGGAKYLNALSREAVALAMYLISFARSNGLTFDFISGYRSPEYQKELQERWDRGDRAGLSYRPADSSAHTRGNAFDIVAPYNTLLALGNAIQEVRGARWGGRFVPPDNNHFDVEG